MATSERTPRLLFCRLYEGECRMDVCVDDLLWERRRLVRLAWHTRDRDPAPPERWWSMVCGEVDYQRAQDQKEKIGRGLPF